jgi:phage shock protein PspC (stress-responsive transcriptional regulator)
VTELKRCPYCAESIRAEAIRCRFCASLVEPGALASLTDPWVRRRQGRAIAGVCCGLAERFGLSVTIVRLAFLLGLLFSGGIALLVYIALWIAMPADPEGPLLDEGEPGRMPE